MQEFYSIFDNVNMMINMAKTQLEDSSQFIADLDNMTNVST